MKLEHYVAAVVAIIYAALIACAVVMLTTSARASTGVYVINADNGGAVYDYYNQAEVMAEYDVRVVIAGTCASACTLYLSPVFGLNVCMYPQARLQFHRPFLVHKRTDEILYTSAARRIAKIEGEWMFNMMPDKIKKLAPYKRWPGVYSGDSPNDMYTLYGKQLIEEGVVHACE